MSAYAPWSTTPILTLDSSTGIASNSAMALDAAGNLYLANYEASPDGAVLEFAPGGTSPSRTIGSLNDPNFIALDAQNDVFVSEGGSDVKEFTPGGGSTPSRTLSNATSGLTSPAGLAVDAAGNLYVADTAGSVSIFAPGTSETASAAMSAGMSAPQWVAFDPAGNLYVANSTGRITGNTRSRSSR